MLKASCTALIIALLGQPAAGAERAVIVVLDGLRSTEGFDDPEFTYIPRMGFDLAPQGALARDCSNNGATLTIPGHAAIGSGRYQNLPDDGSVRPIFPLLWEYYRDQTGAPETATVIPTTKRKIRCMSYGTWTGYGSADSARLIGPTWDDEVTTSLFLADMAANAPVVSMLNLGGIDMGGHTGVWNDYISTIRTADSLVAAIWEAIESDPVYAGRTNMIVTGDHGRHSDGYGDWSEHGDGCPGCRRIPLLALGPDFREGFVSWIACQQTDLCRTLGSVLGIPTPFAGGRLLSELLANPASVPAIDQPGSLRVTAAGRIVRFRIDGEDGPLDLAIYDLLGRRIARGSCASDRDWSWTAGAAGVYFYSAGSRTAGRIVIIP